MSGGEEGSKFKGGSVMGGELDLEAGTEDDEKTFGFDFKFEFGQEVLRGG